ncbi:MAG: MarR family transcriptional regulator [Bacteroidetes bacterium]|nr:MAG: MarR family transcriptional regulator [Bacteroidota bacterium]
MRQLENYIHETLGTDIHPAPISKSGLGNLPMFIKEAYKLDYAILHNNNLILAEAKDNEHLSILQTTKQFEQIKKAFNKNVVLVAADMTAITRKRLIEHGINFIVPGKQMYLPDLLIDLRENFSNTKNKHRITHLLPSAQFIVLYHILHRNEKRKIEEHSFKELAKKFNYTQMAITKAIDNLKQHGLCKAEGTKEKFVRFNYERNELWNAALPLMVNPVLKKIYVDEKPKKVFMLHSNESALPEYSDMNPSTQEYYAIDKTAFYKLQKNNALVNANDYEGKYCLEVWKYNPLTLVGEMPNDRAVVDPLSLYLNLKEVRDARIEMALDKILEKYIW